MDLGRVGYLTGRETFFHFMDVIILVIEICRFCSNANTLLEKQCIVNSAEIVEIKFLQLGDLANIYLQFPPKHLPICVEEEIFLSAAKSVIGTLNL